MSKKHLYILGTVAALFYVLSYIVCYVIDASVLFRVSYGLIGLFAAAVILYLGWKEIPVRADPAQILLIVFMGWYVISCIIMSLENEADWVAGNRQAMRDAMISTLIIFPLGCAWIREKDKPFAAKTAVHAAMIGWTLFIVYILIEMLQAKEITVFDGGLITTSKGRALEINCNQNVTGAWEMVAFMGCLYLMLTVRSKGMKAVYCFSAVIHYVTLVLSSSRTSFLAAMMAFAGIGGVYAWLKLNEKAGRRKVIWTAGAVLGAGAVFYLLRKPVFSLFGQIAYPSEHVGASDIVYKFGGTVLSGRETLWPICLKAMFSSPRQIISGVTPGGIGDLLMQFGAAQPTYTHNEILELIADTGVVGFGICAAWLVIIMKDAYQLYFVLKDRTWMLCVPILIIALLAANMFEAMLLFFTRLPGYFFFLLCGVLHGYVKMKRGTSVKSA